MTALAVLAVVALVAAPLLALCVAMCVMDRPGGEP